MIAFAYYRLPYLHHAIYVAQHEGEPEVLSSVAELNGKEGFVIAPFAPSSECPVVLMHPDESKLISAEGAENASRCGTSYVVTLQDLRRDVAESTSGRNFEAYTREFECFHRQLSEGKFSKIVLARKLRIQARIGNIIPNAVLPTLLKNARNGVPLPAWFPAFAPSTRKDNAIKIPPPMTNGSMWDTPFIRLL